ncbi:AfsR/SARP family transcriptional regulator [Nocardia yamanashiensis]|uniref:AfsR/SARP family transcriptional regulator n=1 Tax=Nocardia yamanashiensis TaxID=209247 RepID=UPI00082D00DF|nr:BTAD domain-containing putative transcriptional regulator [Nocardia yamanashiensis]
MIEFKLLGSVELVVEGRTIDLGPAKQRGIMAALLAEPERPVSTETLADRVWDEAPDTARHSVYTYVTRLRRILRAATAHTAAPVEIRRGVGGYRVELSADRIDLTGFRRLIDRARALRGDDQARAAALAQALRVWRGEALSGIDSQWARGFRDSLRQLRHDAVVEWADAELRLGNPKAVAEVLRKELLEHPLAEDLHERLLKAYHLDNRGAEALSHYDRMRRTFVAELGVDPGQRLRELHGRLLGGQAGAETAAVMPISVRRPSSPEAREPISFRGRAAEIARVRQALTEDTGHGVPPVLVTGGPGIGKSALATRVASLLRERFPDGVLRVALGGSSGAPIDPAAALGQLLPELGITDIPADLGVRAARYRAALSTRRMVVILDDAATDEQIAPLLAVGPGSAALITSRMALGPMSVRTVVLRELPMAESLELLEAVAGPARVRAETWAASALARCCSGIPLALAAVGARLAARPHWTLVDQLGRMSEERQRLEQFAYGPMDIRRSVAVSVDRLSPGATAVFRHLGDTLSPRELFATVSVPGLVNGAGMDALDELVDAHLLSVVKYSDGTRPHYVMLEIHRLCAKWLTARTSAADHTAALPA